MSGDQERETSRVAGHRDEAQRLGGPDDHSETDSS